MRVIFPLFVIFCVAWSVRAEDVQSQCNNPPSHVHCTYDLGELFLDEWTRVELGSNQTACAEVDYSSTNTDSNNNYFVMAVRPGGDGVNATSVQVTAFNNPTQVILCTQVQEGQHDEDYDYACANRYDYFPDSTQGNFTVGLIHSQAGNATLEVYFSFTEGESCTASLVSLGSGHWWWIFLGLVVLTILVFLIAAIAAFIIMKRRKTNYELYQDA